MRLGSPLYGTHCISRLNLYERIGRNMPADNAVCPNDTAVFDHGAL